MKRNLVLEYVQSDHSIMVRLRYIIRDIPRLWVTVALVLIVLIYTLNRSNVKRKEQGPSWLSPEWTNGYKANVLVDTIKDLRTDSSSLYIDWTNTINTRQQTEAVCDRFSKEPKDPKIYTTNVWQELNHYDVNDVTFVTQMTLGKLAVFVQVLKHWDGPVSVTIFVDWQDLIQLPYKLLSYPQLDRRQDLDIHIVLKTGEFYPVNFLRNVANNCSHTDYVFLSDVDFLPVPKAQQLLKSYIKKGHLGEHQVFIVPGFEFFETPEYYPADRGEVLKMWDTNILQPFHWDRHGGVGHRATDYEKWRTTNEIYTIKPIGNYEPYFVMRRSDVPPYRENYMGRMFDKISFALDVTALGFEFRVLPDVYTIHLPHPEITDMPYFNCTFPIWEATCADLVKKHERLSNYNFWPSAEDVDRFMREGSPLSNKELLKD